MKQRHSAREYALQALYQWQLSDTSPKEIVEEFFISHITRPTDADYFKELLQRIPHDSQRIDETFTPFLKRPFDECDPIELAVLRIATYELLERIDIPYRVIINEALELTKTFGSLDGYKFVNGVLDQLARTLRIDECAATRPAAKTPPKEAE